MGFFESNPLLLIVLIIVVVEAWSALKKAVALAISSRRKNDNAAK